MSKGQALIIQFVMFFIIGFALFVFTGNIFKYQSDMFRENILDSGLKLSNSYLSSMIISSIISCKECDFVNVTLRTQNTTAGHILEFGLTDDCELSVYVPIIGKSYNSSIHNFNYSLTDCSGVSASAKPITLTFNRD